jgi:hypothetical protein
MKIIYTTFFLFFLIIGYAIGQPVPPPSNMPAESNRTSWETLNKKYDNPKIVLDGKWVPDSLVKHTLDELDPLAVIKLTILHVTKTGERNTVYITTKDSKIQAYQKKFGAFSKDYADYLDAHQNKDFNFIYMLDERPFQGGRKDIIDGLYDIPAEKIEGVYFSLQPQVNKAIVTIRMKQ